MNFAVINSQGYISGGTSVQVYDVRGRLKVIGGGTPPPPAPVVWGSITGLVTNQTDLINYLGLNYYPLSSNPAGYLTQTAADGLYYPLSSNPAGYVTSAALAGYVPTTRTLTINGTSYDLSADRSWTIAAGGTVTSIGMTVPSGFSVTPSTITTSGTFVITGAGTISQYIDGTGALQAFPTIPVVTPSALTKTDDTNVTLTLGGTPATALLQSVSLTLGWTGTLATSRGGTGLSIIGTALQYLRVNSGGTGLEYATLPTIPAQYNPTAGTGISITGAYPNQTISNTLPDQTVVLTAGTGISTSGTYPNFTITNTSPSLGGTVTSVQLAAGTGISLSGTNPITTSGTITVTNSAPDQVVALTAGTGISITGTYPSFTIDNTAPGVTYTVDNGLTESPANNFQLGGLLLGDTSIDGDANQYSLSFDNMYNIVGKAGFKTSFTVDNSTDSSNISIQAAQLDIGSGAVGSGTGAFSQFTPTIAKLGFTTLSQLVQFSADASGVYIRTPDIAASSATNGQVLTLVDATTGEAEWSTVSSGGLLYGLATQASAGTYTTTISGVSAYTAGDTYIIKFDSVNDGASTLNINGLGAINLYRNTDVKLVSGSIKANQTVEVIYDGTNFQCIGLVTDQLLAYVYNAEGATITKGQVVYAYQATGNKMSVKLALATTDATSAKTVGMVYDASIAAGADGYIIIQGVIEGINTAAYTAGNTLYLSGTTPGSYTATKPYAPIHLVYVGIVERANAGNGQIYVRCQNGYELDEIHDVDLVSTPPVNNDVLVFDTSTNPDLWKAKSIPTILGYTPVPQTRTLTINGTAYDLSADRSWTIAAGGSSATIGATIDGSGGTITVGQKGYVQVPYACTINSWRIIANASGSIVIDIWKAAAPTIPTVANTITAAAKPTLSSQQTAASSTLTGWTTSIAANDILGFNVDSATTVSWVIIQLLVTKI